jgi:hypothetical protein
MKITETAPRDPRTIYKGTAGQDNYRGSDDLIYGGGGSDRLVSTGGGKVYGGEDGDLLIARQGGALYGGAGDDILMNVGRFYWGSEEVRMVGGKGRDTFRIDAEVDSFFAGPDRIVDFYSPKDQIEVYILSDPGETWTLDYHRKSGKLWIDYPGGGDALDPLGPYLVDRTLIARLEPGTKVRPDDLDIIFV